MPVRVPVTSSFAFGRILARFTSCSEDSRGEERVEGCRVVLQVEKQEAEEFFQANDKAPVVVAPVGGEV